MKKESAKASAASEEYNYLNPCSAQDMTGLIPAGPVGDEELVKIHFHTNEPWKVLEYCSSLGEIYDIVVEDMDRQSRGLKG